MLHSKDRLTRFIQLSIIYSSALLCIWINRTQQSFQLLTYAFKGFCLTGVAFVIVRLWYYLYDYWRSN